MSKFLFPALSTIQQPAYEMGKDAGGNCFGEIRQADIKEKANHIACIFCGKRDNQKGRGWNLAKIAVISGSSSIDLVVSADKRPQAGETVLGNSFETVPGGKGANQAVAAARLGADVTMIGRVGDDDFGEIILENLKTNGVNTKYMEPVTHTRSGTAISPWRKGITALLSSKARMTIPHRNM